MAVGETQGGHDSQFRIETHEGFPEPRTRILKHDETFAVLNDFGNMVANRGSTHGLYHKDTRYLSRLELRLNGDHPLLLSSSSAEDGLMLPVDLANTDTRAADGSQLHRELIYMNRRQFVWQSGLHELLLVRNYDLKRHVITLTIDFAADFADIFEVRGQSRARHGKHAADLVGPNTVTLRYRGLDEVERTTSVCFFPTPTALTTSGARFLLDLGPGEWCRVAMRVLCDQSDAEDWSVTQFYRALRAERREFRAARARAASLEGSNPIFNELTERSAADIYLLSADTEHGPYPFAGIPWYSTPFGRDGIITAMLTLWLDPTIAKGVLRFLAATQATTADDAKDAKPGKILHEMRNGEMARLGEVPFGRYYGSVDATPLFVMLLGEYFARTGDLDLVRMLWPNVLAALHWIDTDGDPDHDGFVEYERYSGTGLINQGWKDSADSITHADGELAAGPIALCEVQGYVFAAKRHAAVLAAALGDPRSAARLEAEAETLRERFEAIVLVRGTVDLCIGARWAEAPMPRRRVQCGTRPSYRNRGAGPCRAGRRDAYAGRIFFWLGNSNIGANGSTIQSDFVSQRVGVAAR